MAVVFRTSVLMCFFAFMLNILDVQSQEVVKLSPDETVVKFQDAATVVTESVLQVMRRDVTAGVTPDVCSPHMTCGFLLFDKLDTSKITGPFISYCNSCPEGFECVQDYMKLSQAYYVYKCKRIPTTVAMDATTEKTEPIADSKPRPQGFAATHEL